MIPVARRWANENGLIGQAIHATSSNLQAAGNGPAIEEKIAIQEVVEEIEISEPDENISWTTYRGRAAGRCAH